MTSTHPPVRVMRWLALACLAFGSLQAQAITTWNSGSCVENGSSYGNNYSCTSSTVTATITAWSTTGATPSGSYESADLNYYSGGFGVRNRNMVDSGDTGTTPDEQEQPGHAIDNMTNTDLVLINFGADLVALKQLSIGWWQTDSDITVMRFNAGAAGANPSLTSGVVSGDLTSRGWELIDNTSLFNVGAASSGSPDTVGFNAGNLSSSWWLISAYNSSYGGTAQDSSKDYFKLLSFAGDKTQPPPPGRVSEPASLALAMLGLLGMGRVRRSLKGR